MGSKNRATLAVLDDKKMKPGAALHGHMYNINPDLWVLMREIGTLYIDPENRRKHPERSIADIAKSYDHYGQQKPLVVTPDGKMIAGEGQLIAARDRLSWTHIAAVTFNGTLEDAIAYGLVDNRTGELSEWDFRGLGITLRDLSIKGIDLADLGWQPHESSTIVLADWSPPSQKSLTDGHEQTHHLILNTREWRLVERVHRQALKQDSEVTAGAAVAAVLREHLKG